MPITRSTNQRQVQVHLKYGEHFTQVTKGSSYQHHGCCTTIDTKGAHYSQHGDQPTWRSTIMHKYRQQCQLRAQVWFYTPTVNI